MIHYRDLNSNENTDEYFKAMDDEIQSLIKRDTWEIVSKKSVADNNMLPGTWSLKHRWDLPVLRYHEIMVIYPYPFSVVNHMIFCSISSSNDRILSLSTML